MWKTLGDFILRTWGHGTSTLVLVAVGVFAAGVLHRADGIEAALVAGGHTVWAEVVEPAAWAALLAVSSVTLKATYECLPPIRSKTRFQGMGTEASELTRYIEGGSSYAGLPPWLLVNLVTFSARLEKLGVHAPDIDIDSPASKHAWVVFLVNLRIWIALSDLRSARAYRPPSV